MKFDYLQVGDRVAITATALTAPYILRPVAEVQSDRVLIHDTPFCKKTGLEIDALSEPRTLLTLEEQKTQLDLYKDKVICDAYGEITKVFGDYCKINDYITFSSEFLKLLREQIEIVPPEDVGSDRDKRGHNKYYVTTQEILDKIINQ